MSKKALLAGIILISGVLGTGLSFQTKGLYFGEEPPGTEPKVLAPDFISNRSVVGGTFSPDGGEFLFCRFTESSLRIYFTRRSPSGWSEPEEAEFNRSYFGGPPVFSPDGTQLIWRAARPFPDDWPGSRPQPGTIEEVAYWRMPRTVAAPSPLTWRR